MFRTSLACKLPLVRQKNVRHAQRSDTCGGQRGREAVRAISETGTEEASQQFVPKAHGLIVLETLLAKRELDFCMLVSSLSSVLGGLGFAAYAAANTYMDTFVQKHNERDESGWLSVNWDGWQFEETRIEEEEPVSRYHCGGGKSKSYRGCWTSIGPRRLLFRPAT